MSSLSKQLRLDYINRRLDEYEQNYRSVTEKLLICDDPIKENKLQRQQEQIAQQMDELEAEKRQILEDLRQIDQAYQRSILRQQWDSLQNVLEANSAHFAIMLEAYSQALRCKPGVLTGLPNTIQDLIGKISRYRIVEIFVIYLIHINDDPAFIEELHIWGDQYIANWSLDFYRDPSSFLSLFNLPTQRDSQQSGLPYLGSIETPRSDLSVAKVDPSLTVNKPVILVSITESAEAKSQYSKAKNPKIYQFDAWFVYDISIYRTNKQGYKRWKQNLESPDSVYYTISEIQHLLSQCLHDFNSLSSDSSAAMVQVFLSDRLMDYPIDKWDISLNSEEISLLGCEYQLCLRSIERLSPSYRYYPLWKKKCQRVDSGDSQTVDVLFGSVEERQLSAYLLRQRSEFDAALISIQDAFDLDRVPKFEDLTLEQADLFYDELLQQPIHSILGLLVNHSLSRKNSRDMMSLLLKAGIPLALWQRCPISADSNPPDLHRFLQEQELSEVPQLLQDSRQNAQNYATDAHIGHHIAFLHDDPDLIPPDFIPPPLAVSS